MKVNIHGTSPATLSMSLKPEGRQSTDRRPGDEGYNSRANIQFQTTDPGAERSPDGSNGHDIADRSRQRFAGEGVRNGSATNGSSSGSVGDGRNGRENTQNLAYRERSRTRTNGGTITKTPSGTLRVCRKCDESLTGQFVRALGGTFHLECFKCQVRLLGALIQIPGTKTGTGLRSSRSFKVLPNR